MSLPTYNSKIPTIPLGHTFIGGQFSLPFSQGGFEPKLAMEISDTDWKEGLSSLDDTDVHAVCLYMSSLDPQGLNLPTKEAITIIEKVSQSTTLPLIVWGTGNVKKDAELFAAVATNKVQIWAIGPVQQENHKEGALALKNSDIHLIASTPIDINMAKQLNIMLANQGVRAEKILLDPTVSAIGYGIEYCYSVIERIKNAALAHNDIKLQTPIVCNIGREAQKSKESSRLEDARLGDDLSRAAMWEATSAVLLATAGADLIIMRNAQSIKLTAKLLKDMF